MKFFAMRCKICGASVKYLIKHAFKYHFERVRDLYTHEDGVLNAVENSLYDFQSITKVD